LNANGANDSGLSGNTIQNGGQIVTVVPKNQLYVSVTPLQPYAYVPLSCSNDQFAPGSSGYGTPVYESASRTGVGYTATAVSTQPQNIEVCSPTTSSWTSVYPVKISVIEQSGNSSYNWPAQVFNALGANTVFLTDPQNPNLKIQINNLGAFAGSRSPPSLSESDGFFQGTQGGVSQWYGFNNALQGIAQFTNYWFGTSTSFSSSGGQLNYGSQYWPDGICDASVHPGWEQIYLGNGQPPSAIDPNYGGGYWYAPITPSVSSPVGANYSDVHYGASQSGKSVISQICSDNGQLPMSLIGYLGHAGFSSYDFTPFASEGVSGYSINSSMLIQDLPMPSLAGVGIPTMQFEIPAELLNTVIYQVNSAQFKISSLKPSATSVESGSTVTFSGSIQDSSSYPGTATLYISQNATLFGITPVSPITFSSASQSQSFSFALTALFVKQAAGDAVTLCVGNDAGQITDCKSSAVTILPQPVNGFVNLVIESINAPSSVQVGHDAGVSVTIKNLGISGTAFLNASSQSNTIAAIAPLEQNQSIGSGQTLSIPFTVTGLSGNSTQTVSFTILVSNGTYATSQVFSMNVTAGMPGPCLTNCPPGTPWWQLWQTWAAIGIAAVASVAGFIFYRKH
jgi:hypothetical protein